VLTSEAIMPNKPDEGKPSSVSNTIGRIRKYEQSEEAVFLYGEQANIVFFFMNEHVLRMKLFFDETPDLRTTAAIVDDAVRKPTVQVEEREGHLVISTDSLHAVVNPEKFS
jgi:alpha-glucosidase